MGLTDKYVSFKRAKNEVFFPGGSGENEKKQPSKAEEQPLIIGTVEDLYPGIISTEGQLEVPPPRGYRSTEYISFGNDIRFGPKNKSEAEEASHHTVASGIPEYIHSENRNNEKAEDPVQILERKIARYKRDMDYAKAELDTFKKLREHGVLSNAAYAQKVGPKQRYLDDRERLIRDCEMELAVLLNNDPVNEEEEIIINFQELAEHYAILECKAINPNFSLENDQELYKQCCEKHTNIIVSFKRNIYA